LSLDRLASFLLPPFLPRISRWEWRTTRLFVWIVLCVCVCARYIILPLLLLLLLLCTEIKRLSWETAAHNITQFSRLLL
jgi:hypothetical protein